MTCHNVRDAQGCPLLQSLSPHKSLNVICNLIGLICQIAPMDSEFLLHSKHNRPICEVLNFTYLRKFYLILRAMIIFISKKFHLSNSWWVELPFIPEIWTCKKTSEQVKIEHILQAQTQEDINFMSLCYMTIRRKFQYLD